jgi:negative regulator of sigma E activity
MYDKSLEPMSAMMDGEIEEFELRRVIERASDEQALKDKWQRYHLAQDVMQGRDVQVSGSIDLVSRVNAALESEPSFSSAAIVSSEVESKSDPKIEPKNDKQWWKPMASMAVAASVTAVVLLGAQQYNIDPLASTPVSLASSQIDALPQSRYGNELATVSVDSTAMQNTVVRNAYGMEQYIQKHQDLASDKAANWQVNWLPEGYKEAEHRVSSASEVLLYTNGDKAVSVNIEPLGTQVASQGEFGSNDLLAYGLRAGNSFITVVGQISSDEAAKIAGSISAAKTQ